MTDPISSEDQQWLDALAGHDAPSSGLTASAHAVRRAMQQRRIEIEADAELVQDVGLDRLRSRLQGEGLIRSESEPTKSLLQWLLLALFNVGAPTHGGSRGANLTMSRVIPVALALAIAGGAVWIAMQGRAPQADERLIYRGDPNVVTLLVDNPEQRAKELEAGLKALQGAVTVQALKPNGWLVRVQDSISTRDYLAAQRIEGLAVNGQISVLVLASEKPSH